MGSAQSVAQHPRRHAAVGPRRPRVPCRSAPGRIPSALGVITGQGRVKRRCVSRR
jgi:hypothetical protein